MQQRLIDPQLPRKPEGNKPIQLGAVSLAGRALHTFLAAFVVSFATASMRCTLIAMVDPSMLLVRPVSTTDPAG
jgi:hypothetical protein